MALGRWKSQMAACTVLFVTPLFMGATNWSASFDQRILSVHNKERMALGLEPLNWNPALVESAQEWADHLAATGRFEHAPENRYSPEG